MSNFKIKRNLNKKPKRTILFDNNGNKLKTPIRVIEKRLYRYGGEGPIRSSSKTIY